MITVKVDCEGRVTLQEKNIVKFKKPLNDEEESSLMVVIEVRGDRVLVSDLRFSAWIAPPTDVYSIDDLEVIDESLINR